MWNRPIQTKCKGDDTVMIHWVWMHISISNQMIRRWWWKCLIATPSIRIHHLYRAAGGWNSIHHCATGQTEPDHPSSIQSTPPHRTTSRVATILNFTSYNKGTNEYSESAPMTIRCTQEWAHGFDPVSKKSGWVEAILSRISGLIEVSWSFFRKVDSILCPKIVTLLYCMF